MVKLRFTVVAVYKTNLSITDLVFESHGVFIYYYKAVVGSV
jgi:hypothetical protein